MTNTTLQTLTTRMARLLLLGTPGMILVAALAGCGNKGDLFLIPDDFSQQDLQQLEQVLDAGGIPGAEPVDVEDGYVAEEPASGRSGGTSAKPAGK
jgi:predicted small lipoprotein YifL